MLIFCPRCNAALPDYIFRKPQVDSDCPTCATKLGLTIFPALFRSTAKIDPINMLTVEGEATCFEHANKRAVAVCNKCGRFLCALCEVEVAGQVWCPNCLTSANSGGPIQALEKRRTLFDSIALALASLPALFVYPALITGPTVLYLTIRYWKKPSSIIPRGKWRFIVALLFAFIELGFLVVLVFTLFYASQTTRAVAK